MKITSNAFHEGGKIPERYTKYGENHIPPIHLEDIPPKAKSLALIMDDPDAPNGTFNHWLLFNLDPRVKDIKEDVVPVIATQGRNDFGDVEYGGPRPPSGEHRYYFRAFALDTVLALPRGTKRPDLEKEMKDHVVGQATLMGKYGRGGNKAATMPVQAIV
jgi:Raf kinase inhibitor-like YbhB/YbcL family protein